MEVLILGKEYIYNINQDWTCFVFRWAHGYNGSKLQFIDDQVLLYSCGNILTFIGKNGDHIKSVTSEGRGVGAIAVCQEQGLIAYSEDSLEPLIFIIKYPECSLMHSLKGLNNKDYIIIIIIYIYI